MICVSIKGLRLRYLVLMGENMGVGRRKTGLSIKSLGGLLFVASHCLVLSQFAITKTKSFLFLDYHDAGSVAG